MQGITAQEPRSFSITGTRTIGKTTFLRYLVHQDGAMKRYAEYVGKDFLPSGSRRLLYVYIDFHEFKETDNIFHSMIESLRSEIETLEDVSTRFDNHGDSQQEPADALQTIIIELSKRRIRVVFLMDDFDYVLQYLDDEDEDRLRALNNLVCYIVVTEVPVYELHPETKWVSPFLNILVARPIGLLTAGPARQLVTEPAKDLGVTFTDEEVNLLLEIAGRQPFLLTAACELFFDLRMRGDYSESLLQANRERFKVQFTLNFERRPSVGETLLRFWNKLTAREREVAAAIARGEESDLAIERSVIESLANKSLIHEDLRSGTYCMFGTVFSEFVKSRLEGGREKQGTLSKKEIQEITDTLLPIDRKLFMYFLENPNRICTFGELFQAVWEDPKASRRAVEAAIHRLRKRLQQSDESGWQYIRNVRGKGFRFIPKNNGTVPYR
ncbi:MAG: winged helix-turn-helix domain-containing protein [Thaumarchaeota archaeon]|nr:winged helix-turn-helix domain-containing protein [Nitrososphaerota archaeon]